MATSSSEAPPGTAAARTLGEATVARPGAVARARQILRFSSEELALFARASHDRNPLHCSPDYARGTAFGEPVVFGVLGALVAAGRLRDRPSQSVAKVSVEFRDALQVGIDYQVSLEEGPDRATLTIADGRRQLLLLEVLFRSQPPLVLAAHRSVGSVRGQSANLSPAELSVGMFVRGSYAPDGPSLASLLERYHLPDKGFGSTEVSLLCLASYLVGMELPGERALFARLTIELARAGTPRIDYRATVRSFDERFDLLTTDVELTGDGRPAGTMALESFVRRDLPPPGAFPRSEAWAGKTALVTGASRGLGAAVAQALAWQGCTVVTNYFKSTARAEALSWSVAGASGQIIPVGGDASSLEACQRIRAQLVERKLSLDLLVCNAFPLARSLWIDVHSIERISQYVAESVRMVGTPMSTFLPMLAERGGQLAVVSSAWVNTAPPDWPHYVSAKCAVEGLVQVASSEYRNVRFLLARPPRLLTDLTNTPLGRHKTLPVEEAALAIVARLAAGHAGGTVELLDDLARIKG